MPTRRAGVKLAGYRLGVSARVVTPRVASGMSAISMLCRIPIILSLGHTTLRNRQQGIVSHVAHGAGQR